MLKLIEVSNSLPVSVQAFMAHARIVDADENPVIEDKLRAATEFVGDRCSLQIVPATFRIERNCFPTRKIHILIAPVREIVSVKYRDASGDLQTVDEEHYGWRRTPEGAELEFLPSFSVPAVQPDKSDAVQIELRAGFDYDGATGAGDDPELKVPMRLRQVIMLIAAHWYEHREAVDPAAMHQVPLAAESIMSQLRIWR